MCNSVKDKTNQLKIFDDSEWRYILLLSLFYICAHWLVIVVFGTWWDDWCAYNISDKDLIEWAFSSGRPDTFYLTRFCQMFPWGYKLLVFLMYYFGMLFFYRIIRATVSLEDVECFWISAIYATLPVYDARIQLLGFPYVFGLFLFLFAFYLLTVFVGKNDEWQIIWLILLRTVILFLFFFSFILNSNLVFYALPLLYLIYIFRIRVIRFFDFVMLPIVFWLIKVLCFPVYGIYKDYNLVSVKRLVHALVNLLPEEIYVMRNITVALFGELKVVVFSVVAVFFVFFIEKKYLHGWGSILNKFHSNLKKDMILLCIGIVSLGMGIFAYLAVGSSNISVFAFAGRYAVLTPIGASLMIYAVVDMFFNSESKGFICLLVVLAGIISINLAYLEYQRDYFRQLAFQKQLEIRSELSDKKNIICLMEDDILSSIRFYTLNANAECVYGNQTRMIMNGVTDYKWLLFENSEKLDYFASRDGYHMKEYDVSYKKIDAFITYPGVIRRKDEIKLLFYYMTDRERFDEWLTNNSKMEVILPGTKKYDFLLEEVEDYYEIDNGSLYTDF
ncbi:MAG: hypothetical protein K6F86_09050 [Lachnospiraceae bacterium]|nr:hypothetical protein [Lachnospiraceae bacterium]